MSKKTTLHAKMYRSYLHCFTLQNHFPALWCLINMCLTAQ